MIKPVVLSKVKIKVFLIHVLIVGLLLTGCATLGQSSIRSLLVIATPVSEGSAPEDYFSQYVLHVDNKEDIIVSVGDGYAYVRNLEPDIYHVDKISTIPESTEFALNMTFEIHNGRATVLPIAISCTLDGDDPQKSVQSGLVSNVMQTEFDRVSADVKSWLQMKKYRPMAVSFAFSAPLTEQYRFVVER